MSALQKEKSLQFISVHAQEVFNFCRALDIITCCYVNLYLAKTLLGHFSVSIFQGAFNISSCDEVQDDREWGEFLVQWNFSSTCPTVDLGAKNALQDCCNVVGKDSPFSHYVPSLIVVEWLFVAEGKKLKEILWPLVLSKQHVGMQHKIHQVSVISFSVKKVSHNFIEESAQGMHTILSKIPTHFFCVWLRNFQNCQENNTQV